MGDEFDGPERRQHVGRRSADLIGWRLGTLENTVQEHDLRIRALRDDMIARTSTKARTIQQGDWTIRVLLVFIAGLQLYSNLSHHG